MGLLFVARVDAGDMPKRFEADGVHPAGDMPHLDTAAAAAAATAAAAAATATAAAAAAALPARPVPSHYPGKFSSVVTGRQHDRTLNTSLCPVNYLMCCRRTFCKHRLLPSLRVGWSVIIASDISEVTPNWNM